MAVPLEQFIADNHVRLAWIAFFTLWVLWGLVYTIRFILGESNKPSPDPEANQTEKKIWVQQGGYSVSTRSCKTNHYSHSAFNSDRLASTMPIESCLKIHFCCYLYWLWIHLLLDPPELWWSCPGSSLLLLWYTPLRKWLWIIASSDWPSAWSFTVSLSPLAASLLLRASKCILLSLIL